MKYIRLANKATLILFPDWLSHKDAAADRQVSSAGFVNTETWECYGESASLGVTSHPQSDTRILKGMLNIKAAEAA